MYYNTNILFRSYGNISRKTTAPWPIADPAVKSQNNKQQQPAQILMTPQNIDKSLTQNLPQHKRDHKVALVTGISGQDGYFLKELLLSKGYRVVGTIRRTSVSTSDETEAHDDRVYYHVVEWWIVTVN